MTHPITSIHAEEILDSRKRPTLSVTVETKNASGSFAVPSGASTGSQEAHELRDGDGGMRTAIAHIQDTISPALIGLNVTEQSVLDARLVELDGTPHKSALGGNALIGVSIAASRAAANALGVPLSVHLQTLADIPASRPTPHLFVNLINGGKHAEGGSPFQEHQIITLSEDPREALRDAELVEHTLHTLLKERNISFVFGDEGGAVFPVSSVDDSFELLHEAIARAHLTERITIGTDIAASSFFSDGVYLLFSERFSADELALRYQSLLKKFDITHIEDPFEETDIEHFAALLKSDRRRLVIGDDLTTTNATLIETAAQAGAINGVIIKPNQIGTLTETLEAMSVARSHNIHCIISHRSGDTMDSFIADLAHAFGAYGLKAGAPHAPERKAKYDRLLELE